MCESADFDFWHPEDFTDEATEVFTEDDPWADMLDMNLDESQHLDADAGLQSMSETIPTQPLLSFNAKDDAHEGSANEHDATEGEDDFDGDNDDALDGDEDLESLFGWNYLDWDEA